jgi:hypothetical protein
MHYSTSAAAAGSHLHCFVGWGGEGMLVSGFGAELVRPGTLQHKQATFVWDYAACKAIDDSIACKDGVAQCSQAEHAAHTATVP